MKFTEIPKKFNTVIRSRKWGSTSPLNPFLRNPLLVAYKIIKFRHYISKELVSTHLVFLITRLFP